jgi:hypothetical protein
MPALSLASHPQATAEAYPGYRRLPDSWSTRCLSLGEFLTDFRLLREIVDFLLQMSGTSSIGPALD